MKTKSLFSACAVAAVLAASAASAGAQVVLEPTDKVPAMTGVDKSAAPAAATKLKIGFSRKAAPLTKTTSALELRKAAGTLTKTTSVLELRKSAGALTKTTSVLELRKSAGTLTKTTAVLTLTKPTAALLQSAARFDSPAGAKAMAAKGITTPLVLAPGQSVLIGPTASRTLVTSANRGISTDMVLVTAPRSATALRPGVGPLAATIQREVFPGDLPRLTPESPDVSGFSSAGTLTVGPNGFPVLGQTATAQSGTNPIGPNGFPQPITNGPQSGIQPIDPNGFPATNVAPFAQTGLTRAGTTRDSTAPVRLPATAGSAGVTAVPGSAFSAPTISVPAPATGATAATASPR